MKVSVITNGISEDHAKVCKVMKETGVKYGEIQHVYDKPVENLTLEEAKLIKKLSDENGIVPICVTSHAFVGIPVMSLEIGDATYQKHMDLFKNAIQVAKILDTKLVRTMVFTKQIVTFGSHGSDKWNSGGNKSWPQFIKLYEPIVKLAEDEGIDLCIENGFNGMVSSAYLAKKMIDELGGPKRIKFLWDLANALYYQEYPTVECYEGIKDYLAHIHIKDVYVNTITSEVDVRHIGRGHLAPYLQDLASALRKDNYQGYVSLENIYRPDGGDFIDGYYQDIVEMKRIFE
jgi:sugar phosphate isomerase/epimerase